jgi:Fic family protein
MFIWQHPEWPAWRLDSERLLPLSARLAESRGALRGRLLGLGLTLQEAHRAEVLGDDAAATAKVEGETLPPSSLRSSVVRRLGLDRSGFEVPAPHQRNQRVEGLLEVLEDATLRAAEPLTHQRLRRWHQDLFAHEAGSGRLSRLGAYRVESVEVLSGRAHEPRLHFAAPPAERVQAEMERFLTWWNQATQQDPALTAGLAHLWFETIHPFEDGNGRIGRAIADLTLCRADGQPRRAFSLSRQILEEQSGYYQALESAQRLPTATSSAPASAAASIRSHPLDATPWLEWFLHCLSRAVKRAQDSLERATLRHNLTVLAPTLDLNPRQIKALERLIEAEPQGFQGGLTNRNYRSLTQTSDTTATRDLSELLQKQLLIKSPSGGRSSAYQLNSAFLATPRH